MGTSKRWHIAQWGTLGWIETGIKLVALAIGIWAGAAALVRGGLALPAGAPLAQLIVMALMALGLVAAIGDRLIERESIAMGFVILNNLGHWGMVAYLAASPTSGLPLLAFAGLMLAGDLVKLYFLATTKFTVRGLPRWILFALTGAYVAGYVLELALALLS